MERHPGALPYRAEIDGLRAISVIAVVVYHAGFSFSDLLGGGFLGVDVFFVISGYLIALKVFTDLEAGNFSFAGFYDRRARRILPVLLLVFICSLPFAWAAMQPIAMKAYAGSILSSLAFGSNFWFLSEDSYTAEASMLKPFLHTWSLSVEEQFYLVFPVAALLAWRHARKYAGGIFAALLLCSLLLAEQASRSSPEAAFFLAPYRAWEILVGVMLALFEHRRGRPAVRGSLPLLMPSLGIGLILYSFLAFDDSLRHPSSYTLLPVLGTAFLIFFCRAGEPVTWLLSSPPARAIGKISYGFYLWHFPFFSFARMLAADTGDWWKLALSAGAALAATLSYFLLEKPCRNKTSVGRKTFLAGLAISAGLTIVGFSYIYKTDGAAWRFAGVSRFVDLNYWGDDKIQRYTDYATHYGCWVWVENRGYDSRNPFGECRRQEASAPARKIMVIGDSHAAGLVPGLIRTFGRDSIYQRTASTCFPSPRLKTPSKAAHPDYCLREMKDAFRDIEAVEPDLILLSASWQLDGRREIRHRDYFYEELPDLLGSYRDRTILVGPLVRWPPKGLRNNLVEFFGIHGFIPEKLRPMASTFLIDERMSAIAADIGLAYLSPVATFCEAGQCLTKVGAAPGAVLSWDRSHISMDASAFLIERNIELIKSLTQPHSLAPSALSRHNPP